MHTRLAVLILFGFLSTAPVLADHGERMDSEHMGTTGAREEMNTLSNSDWSVGQPSFRWVPACSPYIVPGTSSNAAPFGAGGTGLNGLACNEGDLPEAPLQQAGQIGIRDPDQPKLVPSKPNPQPEGVTEKNMEP